MGWGSGERVALAGPFLRWGGRESDQKYYKLENWMLVAGGHYRDNARLRVIKRQLTTKCEGQRATDRDAHLPGEQKS